MPTAEESDHFFAAMSVEAFASAMSAPYRVKEQAADTCMSICGTKMHLVICKQGSRRHIKRQNESNSPDCRAF
jgi:hypothetical protein